MISTHTKKQYKPLMKIIITQNITIDNTLAYFHWLPSIIFLEWVNKIMFYVIKLLIFSIIKTIWKIF